MIRELFCWHEYKPMTFYKDYWDIEKYPDAWEFRIIYRCTKCMRHKEEVAARGKIEKFFENNIPK